MKIQKMSAVRRFISVFVLVSLPFSADASFAHNYQHHSSAPSVFRTAPTGTEFSAAARNQMFLTSPYEGYVIAGASLTTPITPWVNGLDVIVSEIPFVEGQVYWKPEFKTWVDNGVRYFTGNGVPNHPTGAFPIAPGQPAYPYYAAIPDPDGEYPNAAYFPIEPYDLYMAVPANPVYSDTPTAFSELTIAIAIQSGATFHSNIAITGDLLFVDPIAALPLDECWGHPAFLQYHYHGWSWKCFPNQGNENEHSPLFGVALDGFGVFGPRGDGGVLLTNDQLDVCHGHFGKIDWDGIQTDMYHYHLNTQFPYGPGCFRGTQIGTFSSNGPPVPGPAPLLGALAALRWSRRLRKRCSSACIRSR
jgi:hypothetical protein